jgi:heme A synthase
VLALWVGSRRDRFTPLVVASTAALVILAFIQIFTGVAFMVWGTPPIVEVFHLWIASLMIGILLVVYSASRAQATADGPNLKRVPVSTGGK